ncbi:MAG: hypothetical protein L6Q34_05630 [Nitrospira sp.]|nr:hypothetical protein [Nitrospira sp.]MEB2339144.1 hypothetical protein [Nitrospirales bacterium]QOJ34926.1 MAG: hypothetical protein HRU82_08190 [Nitrospira sp.]
MMRSSTKKTAVTVVALGIAWLYLALALVAPGCSFAHATPSTGHHQHSGTESHSTLCFWACQATSDVGPASHGDHGMVWVAQAHTPLPVPPLLATWDHSSRYGRAPPIPARG